MRRGSAPVGRGLRFGSRMCRVNWSWYCWNEGNSGVLGTGTLPLPFCLKRRNAPDFGRKFFQRRDVKVALKQRWMDTEDLEGFLEQRPNRVDYSGAVGVHDQVFGFPVMAGDMQVNGALGRQRADELQSIVAVVNAVYINIINVEMQQAIGLLEHRLDEFELGHFIDCGRDIERSILYGDFLFQDFLRAANACRHITHGFLGKRNRHQVVHMAVVAAIAQVLGVELDLMLSEEGFDAFQKNFVERRGPAQR